MLLLPERRAGFQPVDQEGAGFQSLGTVAGGGADHHDCLADRHAPNAVDEDTAKQRPARDGLADQSVQTCLGHCRIMFELDGYDSIVVTRNAGKAGHRAAAQICQWHKRC